MSNPFQALRLLLVGSGSIGRRHARILADLGVNSFLICDPIPERREAVRKCVPAAETFTQLDEALAEQPDAAFILTPPRMHIPMAVQAIEAGCHVFSEKPLSDSLDGVQRLIDAVAVNRKRFMVGLCFRYHRSLLKAKKILEDGTIGRLIAVRALMGEHLPDVRPDYKSLFTSQYSGAFDLTHDIDLAIWYVGQDIRSVKSVFGGFSDIGIAAPDVVEMLIEFEDRAVASIHLDFFQRPRRRQIELIGTEGVIVVEFGNWNESITRVWRATNACWSTSIEQTDRDDMFRDEDCEFLNGIVSGSPIACNIEEALKSVRVVLAAQGDAGALTRSS